MDSIVRFLFLSTDGVEISGAHFSLGARYRHFSPTKEEYTLAICLKNFTLRHNEIIVIWSVISRSIELTQIC